MIRSPATFAKVEKRYLTYSTRQIRVRCYRTVYASTKPLIQLFHSDERPVIGYSKLSCEHGLHGGCFSRSTPAGYCSLQQRSQKRPLSIGAVSEPNCYITTRARIDEPRRISRRNMKRDRHKKLMAIFKLRTLSHSTKVLRYEVI